jgi:hypothetical protein
LGKVIENKKVEKSYSILKSFAALGVSKQNFALRLSSGYSIISFAFSKQEKTTVENKNIQVWDNAYQPNAPWRQ